MEITGNISVSVLQFVLLQDVGADTLFSFPFSAYFPRVKEEPDLAKEKPAEQTKVWLLPIEKITPSPFQARTVFDEGEIKKLAVSIFAKRTAAAHQCPPYSRRAVSADCRGTPSAGMQADGYGNDPRDYLSF